MIRRAQFAGGMGWAPGLGSTATLQFPAFTPGFVPDTGGSNVTTLAFPQFTGEVSGAGPAGPAAPWWLGPGAAPVAVEFRYGGPCLVAGFPFVGRRVLGADGSPGPACAGGADAGAIGWGISVAAVMLPLLFLLGRRRR